MQVKVYEGIFGENGSHCSFSVILALKLLVNMGYKQ